jgi:hypothetical protein
MIDRVMRYRNDAAYVQYAEIWTGRQNAVYSNYNDKWILKQDARYEEMIDDYIFNEEHNDKNTEKLLKLIEQRRKEHEERRSARSSTTKSKLEDITNELESVLGSIDTRGWGELRHPDTITQLFERASGNRPTRRTRVREDDRDEPDMQVEASSPQPTRTYSSRWAQAVGTTTSRILGEEIGIPQPVEEVPFESVTAEQNIDMETTYTYNSDMWTSNNWSPVEYEEDRDEELCTEDENPF